jgi:hypothetical protein
MTKKTSIMLAMAGAALFAASQAQAQTSLASYATGDLVLNFRDPINATSVADVTVNLGSITSFAALTGTTVLDNGGSYGFTESEIAGAFGSPTTEVGFSVVGVNAANDTWMTRVQSSASLTPPTAPPTITSAESTQIGGILTHITAGATPAGFGGTTGTLLDPSGAISQVSSGQTYSYQSLAADSTAAGAIDYNANINLSTGGNVENIANLPAAAGGATTAYSALWEQTPGTTGRSGVASVDTYLGYFTFNGGNDELDFTSVNPSAVPEPTTYGLLAGAGLLAVALRRQFRSQNA